MAKTIPQKKAAAKKKRQGEIEELFDPKAQRKLEREIDHYVQELDEKSEEREKYVKVVLEANDDSVSEIIDQMVEQLRQMEGAPKIVYKGQTYNAVKGETELLAKIQTRNFRFVAVRCLVALAKWDVRVGSFKLPKKLCADCGVRVK